MNELSTCPPGFYRSKKSGRCKKDKLKPCPDGYLRDEKTRRCKKLVLTKKKRSRTIKDCPPGYSRTGKNNRCQKDCPPGTTRSGKNNKCLKNCPPGRERNSKGRCVNENGSLNSFIVKEDEPLIGEGERWMKEEIAELKKGRLGKDLRHKITCLEMFDDDALRKELEKRKRVRDAPPPPPGAVLYQGKVVNMVAVRKKPVKMVKEK